MMIPSIITMSESTSSSSSSSDDENKKKHDQQRHTHTRLTYSRHHLVDVAHETIKISENGYYVNQHVKLSLSSKILIRALRVQFIMNTILISLRHWLFMMLLLLLLLLPSVMLVPIMTHHSSIFPTRDTSH